MIKSLFRALSVAMLIVGTVIGAGFASGKEVVAFFGCAPNIWTAFIAGVLVFVCSTVFLFIGKCVKKTDVGEVNGVVFGRWRLFADVFMLFNSMIVLGAMLAGTDSLVSEFINIRPLASIIMGVLCAVTAVKGIQGVIKTNAILVPIMITFLCVCSLCSINYAFDVQTSAIDPYNIVLYVSMNMILGGSVLTTVHKLSSREIIISSVVAAILIGGLLTVMMYALRTIDAAQYDMPMLVVALKSGSVMYLAGLPVLAASIFTTMLSAFKSVYDYIVAFVNNRLVAASSVLVCGLAVGALGFSNVVNILYPVIGGMGLLYLACNVLYLIKSGIFRNAPNFKILKIQHKKSTPKHRSKSVPI